MNMFLAELPKWLTELVKGVKYVINPILILATLAGTIYAIVVGVKFVKADSKDEREEAKQKLISVIIGVVVTLALIIAFYWLSTAIQNGIIDLSRWYGGQA